MDTLTLTDRAGDTLEVRASGGEVDIIATEKSYSDGIYPAESVMICLDRKQAKQLRKQIKKLLNTPYLVD